MFGARSRRTVTAMIVFLPVLCVLAAGAEPGPSPGSFSISSYTAAALLASPEVQSAEDGWRAAEADYRAQLANMLLPTAALSAAAYPYGYNPANNYRFQTWRLNRSDLSFNTTLNLNLFNSLQDYERMRSAELGRQSARRAVLAARQDRSFAAVQAFYDLDSKTELVDVAQQNLKAQRDQYAQSLDLYNNGMKSLADLLKSETDMRSSELRLVQAQSDQQASLVTFNALIDRDRLLPAALTAVLEPGATALPLLDEDTARALAQRPEVVKARKDLEKADVAVTQAIQALLPTFKVDATWNHTDTANFGGTAVTASQVGIPDPNYYLGLSLSLPLGFNGVSQAYAVVQAKANKKAAAAGLASQERGVRSEVANAHVSLEKAMRSYTVSLVKEQIAKRALDLVSSQYRQGSADAIRMNQAQGDYLDARVQSVLALHDIFIDRAHYRRAVGDPLW